MGGVMFGPVEDKIAGVVEVLKGFLEKVKK
jgi:hypothetical protein